MTITAHRVNSGPSTSTPGDLLAALLQLLAQAPHWPDRACRGEDPSLWDDRLDLPDRETDTARAARHDKAKTICGNCPRITECRAMRLGDPNLGGGIWAGELFSHTGQMDRCAHCKKDFPREHPQRRKYCSPDCRKAAHAARERGAYSPAPTVRQLPPLTHCQACGLELSPAKQRTKARSCDQKCRLAAKRERQRRRRSPADPSWAAGGRDVTCIKCGAEFRRTNPSVRYCGDQCRRLANADLNRAARQAARATPPPPCAVCHAEIPTERLRRRFRTCTDDCSRELDRTTRAARRAALRGTPASTPTEREVPAA